MMNGGPHPSRASPFPIELRIREIGQLFHSLDPLPFRERDLDPGLEEYVVGGARELGRTRPIEIVIHLPATEALREEAHHVAEAIQHYFSYRADVTEWELKELFRIGRASFAIGITVLASCVVLGGLLSKVLGGGYLGRFLDEGLIILGWVANWRPIQIALYDWWPLVRRRELYRRLARATVRLDADLDRTEDRIVQGMPAGADAPGDAKPRNNPRDA